MSDGTTAVLHAWLAPLRAGDPPGARRIPRPRSGPPPPAHPAV